MRPGRGTVIAVLAASAIVMSAAAAPAATKPPTKKDVAALERSVASLGAVDTAGAAFEGTQILAASEAPFGAIAVGLTDGRVSIWTSKDAKRWTRVPEAALGAPAEVLDAATLYGELLVTADADGAIVLIGSDVLTSRNGKQFTFSSREANGIPLRTEPVQVDRLTYGNAPPLDVAVGPERSVLVGSGGWSQQAGGGSPNFVPTVWRSDDRTTWTGDALKPANATPGIANAVVALDKGGFVMAGADTYAETGSTVGRGDDAAVWTSSDGDNWTRGDPASFAAPGTQEITHLVALGDRLVAAGFDAPGGGQPAAAAVWTSEDAGRTWTRTALDPAVFPVGSQIADLVATPRGFVAIGVNGASVTTRRSAMWVSPDGSTWTQAYVDPVFSSAPSFAFAFGADVLVLRTSDAFAGSATTPARPARTSVAMTGIAPPKRAPTTTTTRPAG